MKQIIKCEECGLEMLTRINGSHLKRKHNMSLSEYVQKYPNAKIGKRTPIRKEYVCMICNENIKSASSLSRHVDLLHKIDPRSYYDKFISKSNTPKCKCGCGEDVNFINIEKGYREYKPNHAEIWNKNLKKHMDVRVANMHKNRIVWNKGLGMEDDRVRKIIEKASCADARRKMVNTNKKRLMDKFGVENVFQLESVKNKIKETNIDRYGFESPMQCESIIEKGHQTKFLRNGDRNFNNTEKNRETCMLRYGVKHPSQVPEISDRNTKSRFHFKDYILPSGKVIRLQGYEPFCIDILLREFEEHEILHNRVDVPKIWYMMNGKNKRYYCDFYIPSKNLVIEVKSTYTNTLDADKIKLKEAAVKLNGFNYRKYVFGRNKNELKIYE